MKIISKKELIATVAERWNKSYKGTKDERRILIGKRLKEEKPQTEKEIAEIIGNPSWTHNYCNECDKDCEITIQIGEESDYESNTAWICKKCLKKALKLLTTK